MIHCNSDLSICISIFYHIVIKSVLNGIGFAFYKEVIRKFNKSRDLFY